MHIGRKYRGRDEGRLSALLSLPQKPGGALRNESGIALVMVLVISLISLAIVSTLVYLVVKGTRFSGAYKRYATVREAGIGISEIFGDLIVKRGQLVIPGYVNLTTACNCGDPLVPGDTLPAASCLCRKLCDPAKNADGTSNWNLPNCSDSLDPTSNPDMQLTFEGLGGTSYQVSVKIVDSVVGNTSAVVLEDTSGKTYVADFDNTGVVYGGGDPDPPPMPYLYRAEITVQDAVQPMERAKFSVLYGF